MPSFLIVGMGNATGRRDCQSAATSHTARANKPGRLLVHLQAVAGVDQPAGDPGQGIHHREDGEASLLLGDLDRLLGQGSGNPVLAQGLLDLVGVAAERGFHRPLDGLDEAVAAFVPFLDQRFDGPADFAEGLVDVRGVFPRELNDFHRVPDDVILAQTAWNQNVSMPTERQPTSEFQRKNPGAKASPPMSVQPAGSMRKQNMSCSPPYRPVAPLKPLGGGWKSTANSWTTASRSALNSRV